ncbi:MAG: NUDIX hydrolase [Chloroflexi bacterium]|nr:NUDIX hydrolase [Chloroflexota bacterium]
MTDETLAPPIRVVRSEVVHEGIKFRVVRDIQLLPDGSLVPWESVVHGDLVLALPIDRDGAVYLLRQYRPQLERDGLEAIGGGRDGAPTPEEAMHRELREEAGITAALVSLGTAELGAATARCHEHLYLALVQEIGEPALEPFEQITIRGLERVPLAEAVRLAMSGAIVDVNSRLVVLMANEHLRTHPLATLFPGSG